MSSSEQAPEPTMDEILASIRRIIAEDDDGEGKQQEAGEQSAPEPEAEETETSELAEAIAETLHQEDAEASAIEEVLELTEEVEQIAVAASQAGDLPLQPEVSDFGAETAAPDPISPETDETGVGDVTEVLVSEQVIIEATEAPAPPMGEIPGVTQDAEFEADQLAGQSELSDEVEAVSDPGASIPPSSIAEAVEAIARGAEPAPKDMADLESAALEAVGTMLEEQDGPDSQPDSVPSSSFYEAPAEPQAAESETVEVLVEEISLEVGVVAGETAGEEEAADETVTGKEQVETADAPDSLEEMLTPSTNGPGASSNSALAPSLETSVKEMLRPMLREWLDDNLPRIIENAVKDEIASSDKQKD